MPYKHKWRKHTIPLGTRVAFKGETQVYVIDCYQSVLECGPDCDSDHDCYPEPYVCVKQESWTALPLSKLRTIFPEDRNGIGRVATEKDKEILDAQQD